MDIVVGPQNYHALPEILKKKEENKRYIENEFDVKKKFDLIMIKQTIHLLKYNEIKKLIYACKMQLNQNGKILILSLETSHEVVATPLRSKLVDKRAKSEKRNPKKPR